MQKRKLLLVSLLLIFVIAASFIALTCLNEKNNPLYYSKTIERNTSNAEEEHALNVAENLNYAEILNVSKLSPYPNSKVYSSDYSQEIWANLIDSQVIDYYSHRYDSLKFSKNSIHYNYSANVHTLSQMQVMPKSTSTGLDNNSISVMDSNGTVLLQNVGWGTRYFYFDGSDYQEIQGSQINFTFTKCYALEMNLKYSEVSVNLGYLTQVTQIVILDENYQPRIISNLSSNAIG